MTIPGLALLVALAFAPSFGNAPERRQTPAMPVAYRNVLTSLGRSGDFKDNVLKVNLGRSDLKVTINGRAMPTPIGFGGWVAFTPGDQGNAGTLPHEKLGGSAAHSA